MKILYSFKTTYIRLIFTIALLLGYSISLLSQESYIKEYSTTKNLFSVKTNLLYDLALIINVGVEKEIANNISIEGNIICPWWKSDSKQRALQILAGEGRIKYWINNKSESNFTGFFAGVYGYGGKYDVEWNKKGYQGEAWSIGAVGGYAHKISKSLKLEYSLNIGYLHNQYRHYNAIKDQKGNWHLIKHSTQPNQILIGPTGANVSIIWIINSKK